MTGKTDNSQPELYRAGRPSVSVPSFDRPREDPSERKSRHAVTKRDQSPHRLYRSLYEDMLN